MIDRNDAVRLAPRDFLEIFGESWKGGLGSAGQEKERSDRFLDYTDDSVYNSNISVHLIQPRSVHDDSPLSRVASDYKIAARRAITHGTPIEEIFGPAEIDVSAFLDDESATNAELHLPRVDKWASFVNKSFRDVDVFVGLGCLYLHWSLMRVSCAHNATWHEQIFVNGAYH